MDNKLEKMNIKTIIVLFIVVSIAISNVYGYEKMWKDSCPYVFSTQYNSTFNNERCLDFVEKIFDPEYMNIMIYNRNCKTRECLLQLVKCMDVCSKYEIVNCAECLGKLYVECCECVLPEHMCSR